MTYSTLYVKNGLRLAPPSTISLWGCKDSTRPTQLTMARLQLPLHHLVTLRLHLLQGTRLHLRQMVNPRRLLVAQPQPPVPQDRLAQLTTWHTGGPLILSSPIYQLTTSPGLRMGTTSILKHSSNGMRKRWLRAEAKVLLELPLPVLLNCTRPWSPAIDHHTDMPM